MAPANMTSAEMIAFVIASNLRETGFRGCGEVGSWVGLMVR